MIRTFSAYGAVGYGALLIGGVLIVAVIVAVALRLRLAILRSSLPARRGRT